MLVYLDSNIVIYSLEKPAAWVAKVKARMKSLRAARAGLIVSDLTRMECQVGPLIRGDSKLLRRFAAYFSSPNVRVLPLTPQVCDRAAQIRADYRFKTPDSLHLAAAVEGNCDVFLTNDQRLSKFQALTVEAL